MANSLGNGVFNPGYWAREQQTIFYKENVAIGLANTELRAVLNDGDTVHKPYSSHLYGKTYTKGTDVTVIDVSGTDEYLTVDTTKIVPFYVDDLDKLQNKWDMADHFAKQSQRILNNLLDQTIAAEYSNANSDIYAADVGGSGATTAITLGTANIQQLFTAAGRKLDSLDMPQAGRFSMIGPRTLEILRLYIGGKDTDYADAVSRNGLVMNRFGFDIYYSNNCAFTATWTPANQPTAADTVSIAGVTFTFQTTIGTTAGNVLSETSVAISIDNLVAAVNGSGETENTDWVAVSDANRWKLTRAGVVATDGATALTLVAYGDIVVAASEANDPWSVQTQHSLFGIKGATDLVVQKTPNVVFKEDPDRLGKNVFSWMMYGKKTFNNQKDALVDVNILASSWV